jgi:hypothetical protein
VLFLAIVLLDTWKPNLEVRRAKMKNDIKIEGSYFSFSGSIIITIKKEE